MKRDIHQLKTRVLKVLEEQPATRNSDIALTLAIWRKYYDGIIITAPSGVQGVKLEDLFRLPREDNVKRVRAHIQNDLGKFLPTSWEVAKQRKIEEATWRVYMASFHPSV